MDEGFVKVNLHCHSSLSDGDLSPEELASFLASKGTTFAALTDHDSLEGLQRFKEALGRYAVGQIDGVEISTETSLGETHLLAYGLRAPTGEFFDIVSSAQSSGGKGIRGMPEALRKGGGRLRSGRVPAAECIRAAHRSGWSVFLAHPLSHVSGPDDLGRLLDELVPAGLDGMEAIYGPYDGEAVSGLREIAWRRGLRICAGSDFHEREVPGQAAFVEMPIKEWKAFRDLLLSRVEGGLAGEPKKPAKKPPQDMPRIRAGRFLARIVFPALVAVALFVAVLFALILPRFETALLERKKETIRELTDSAASVLAEFAGEESKGKLSREAAQMEAASRIRDIRYGQEGKDYFWITDMKPRMIMHPYRLDLVGKDLSEYRDAAGFPVFTAFVDAVRDAHEGYVEYLWQWKDDGSRIVPKLSFVKKFEPWDWVIGTGVYLEDVNAEIDGIERGFIWISIGITVILALLLSFIAQQSLAIEKERLAAENGVRESRERYRALVEASTEGMLIAMDGRCTYANGTFLELTGYGEAEAVLLDIEELLEPDPGEGGAYAEFLRGLSASGGSVGSAEREPKPRRVEGLSCECRLKRVSGKPVEVAVSATRFALSGREGWILAFKDLGESMEAGTDAGTGMSAELFEALGIGSFRTRFARKALIVAADPPARRLFGIGDQERMNFALLLSDPSELDRLLAELEAGGMILERVSRILGPAGEIREVFLSALPWRGSEGTIRFVDWIAVDARPRLSAEKRREGYLAELRSASLVTEGPISPAARKIPRCGLSEPIRKAAELMKDHRAGAVFVTDGEGNPVGIVGPRDLSLRALAESVDPDSPVSGIMSSPIAWIRGDATLGEALVSLREKGTGGLAVRGPKGEEGFARDSDLIRLFSAIPTLIREKAARANTVEALKEIRLLSLEHIRSLAAGGIGAKALVRLFDSFSGMVAERTVALSEKESGAAPRPYAFVAVGSGGRRESLPRSDQDNAIIYLDDERESEKTAAYFRDFGRRICDTLEAIGIPPCPGGIMSSNPEWCVPLERWRKYFSLWIGAPDPKELLDLNIFFDLRHVSGDSSLTGSLKDSVSKEFAANPNFFLHLAKDAIQKRFSPDGGSVNAKGMLDDLKEISSRISGFARLYSLRHGVDATNTFERLEALEANGVLPFSAGTETAESFEFILLKRLEIQLHEGYPRSPGSASPFSRPFSPKDEALLRIASAQVQLLAKRISFDFFGSAL